MIIWFAPRWPIARMAPRPAARASSRWAIPSTVQTSPTLSGFMAGYRSTSSSLKEARCHASLKMSSSPRGRPPSGKQRRSSSRARTVRSLSMRVPTPAKVAANWSNCFLDRRESRGRPGPKKPSDTRSFRCRPTEPLTRPPPPTQGSVSCPPCHWAAVGSPPRPQ